MGEAKKMWYIGLWSVCLVLMLSAILQVCYRTQNKMRNRVRNEIVQTQQDIAAAQADFSSYVRPEILRNMVVGIAPESEIVSFHKYVSVSDLPNKQPDTQQ